MNEKELELYREAMEKWGLELQIGVLAEECVELAKPCLKMVRQLKVNGYYNDEVHRSLLEEIADVQIMLNQLYFGYLSPNDLDAIEAIKQAKLARVRLWLDELDDDSLP